MPIARDFIPRQARRGPCGVMQVDIITCHTNLSSHQVRVRAELGGHSGRSWFGVMLRAVEGRPRYAGRPTVSWAGHESRAERTEQPA